MFLQTFITAPLVFLSKAKQNKATFKQNGNKPLCPIYAVNYSLSYIQHQILSATPQLFFKIFFVVIYTFEMEKKLTVSLLVAFFLSFEDYIPRLFGLFLGLALASFQCGSYLVQKQFEKAQKRFSCLKKKTQDLASMRSILHYRALVKKLGGQSNTNQSQPQNIQNQLQKCLTEYQKSLLESIKRINQKMDAKIFQIPAFESKKETQKHCSTLLDYLNYSSIQIDFNWHKMTYEKVQFLLLLNRELNYIQRKQQSLTNQFSEISAHNKVSDHKYFKQISSLQQKLCSQSQLSPIIIQQLLSDIKKVQEYVGKPKQRQENLQKNKVQVFTIGPDKEKQVIMQKNDRIQIREQFEQGNKDQFKKRLDSMLVFGWQQRKQKLEELEEKQEMTKETLAEKVEHSKQKNYYEIAQTE